MPKARHNGSAEATSAADARYLPLMLVLFVGSGAAALIYEIVWFQMLQLVVGSSGISIGVLLGSFMGGMCIGSLLAPRMIGTARHPLRVYAMLEVGIAVLAVLLLFLIPAIGGLYSNVVGHGTAGILLRAFFCALLLLPPTILMGATLPAIARSIETSPRGVSWMGFFYGGNIAGAVVGSLVAGFYLLRVHDIPTATFVAVVINLAVAGLAVLFATMIPYDAPAAERADEPLVVAPGARIVYVGIALSGLTALGAEVVWTRLLSLLLGATVYTFSIILGVFLIGLGIGSTVGSVLARTLDRPRIALGLCQLGVAGAIAWSAYALNASLPFWPINPSITASPWVLFQIDFARAVWAILPGTLLWGASFPLAVAAIAAQKQDPARLLGSVYAANTVGAILGATIFGVLLIPLVGTQNAQRVLLFIALVSALILLIPALRARDAEAPATAGIGKYLGIGAAVMVALLLLRDVREVPPVLVAYGRYAPTYAPPNALFVGEGMNSSVAVTELGNGVRNFHVSGKVEASTEPQDMRLQRMLGHLSALLHPEPKTVLVVGFGAGVTAGSFIVHPSVTRIVICEIEPLIPKVVSQYFGDVNYNVLNDPRVEVVYDDARHYILTTDEKFDVITSDPIHPWVKGAAALYTKEYFELAKRHLNPGGVITQWVPLYESIPEVVKSEFATFFDVFPDGTVWGNDVSGAGYDVVLAGSLGNPDPDPRVLQERLARPDHAPVVQSLGEVGFFNSYDLLGTYAGRGPDLKPWLVGAEINRDRNLRLMYIAGMGNNRYEQASIYDQILQHRQAPAWMASYSPLQP